MGKLVNHVTQLHQATSRSYIERMVDDKVQCMLKAKEYELDYLDEKQYSPTIDLEHIFFLTAVGDTLYFRANDSTNGEELWKSDGTSAGTVMVKDINSGTSSSTPQHQPDQRFHDDRALFLPVDRSSG